MRNQSTEIVPGITMFDGSVSSNLLYAPMVSHSYFLERDNEVVIFDPSCGAEIARRIQGHIDKRIADGARWEKACIVVGHSHIDHANNLFLVDTAGAGETGIYAHEDGMEDGRIRNEPVQFVRRVLEEHRAYYPPYSAFYWPYSLLMYPFALLDRVSPELTARLFAAIGTVTYPSPRVGSTRPQPPIGANIRLRNCLYVP